MLKSTCRQCRASLPLRIDRCPMCGLVSPNQNELSALEKEFLQENPLIPAQHHEMCHTVDPSKTWLINVRNEIAKNLATPSEKPTLWLSYLGILLGGLFLLLHIAFPLSFMIFWAGLIYAAYDSAVFFRAVSTTHVLKKLQHKRGVSPYSVQFKVEKQLEEHLLSLRSVTSSILERDWTKTSPELKKASESFLVANKVMTERIKKHAVVALETASIIWRNNVYALLANDDSPQDKVMAVGAKCREAEAMLLRFLWLMNLSEINPILEDFVANPRVNDKKSPTPYPMKILEQFHLTMYGPTAEEFSGNFEHTPHQIPFKGRVFWHQRLPPFPFEDDGSLSAYPQAQELIASLTQVRLLKAHLEEQMVLDCVTKSVSNVSPLDSGYPVTLEAKELSRDSLYASFLDVPKFRPDSEEVQNAVDKLVAEAKVALGSEEGGGT